MFLFAFLSTISRQSAGRFTPNFARGRTLVPGVSSPLLGVSAPPPRGAEKGGNVEYEWRVCVSSTDALVILIFSCRNSIEDMIIDYLF